MPTAHPTSAAGAARRTGARLLESETSDRGQVISHEQIVNLPLNGRSNSSLALLSTGVLESNQNGVGTSGREGSFNVNGLRNKFSEPDASVLASARACLAPLSAERGHQAHATAAAVHDRPDRQWSLAAQTRHAPPAASATGAIG